MLHSLLNFISSLLFAVVAIFGINIGTKEPRYDVVERVSANITIRRYPARVVAETTIDVSKSENPQKEAFQILAGYIFGANERRQNISMTAPVEIRAPGEKIAMTAPVELHTTQKFVVMRFFMPANYAAADLPDPADPRVKLIELASTTVAVSEFSGRSNPDVISLRAEALLAALQPTNWKPSGPPTVYVYNPPWTIPFLRRNEVVIPVSSQ